MRASPLMLPPITSVCSTSPLRTRDDCSVLQLVFALSPNTSSPPWRSLREEAAPCSTADVARTTRMLIQRVAKVARALKRGDFSCAAVAAAICVHAQNCAGTPASSHRRAAGCASKRLLPYPIPR